LTDRPDSAHIAIFGHGYATGPITPKIFNQGKAAAAGLSDAAFFLNVMTGKFIVLKTSAVDGLQLMFRQMRNTKAGWIDRIFLSTVAVSVWAQSGYKTTPWLEAKMHVTFHKMGPRSMHSLIKFLHLLM